ncbi:MAG: hypothetical protein V1722_02730 [Candidatus Micrarchaeota archaeon]
MIKATKTIQAHNKVHGAYLLREAYRHLEPGAREKICIAPFKYVAPVHSFEEIKAKVIRLAKGNPAAERILIRGNPTENILTGGTRHERYAIAPRGHFHTKPGQFTWDNTIEDQVLMHYDPHTRLVKRKEITPGSHEEKQLVYHYRTTNWLLYPTKAQEQIAFGGSFLVKTFARRGYAEITWYTGDFRNPSTKQEHIALRLNKSTGKITIPPEHQGKLELVEQHSQALGRFLKALANAPGVRGTNSRFRLRFTVWKDEPNKLEFYDCIKSGYIKFVAGKRMLV